MLQRTGSPSVGNCNPPPPIPAVSAAHVPGSPLELVRKRAAAGVRRGLFLGLPDPLPFAGPASRFDSLSAAFQLPWPFATHAGNCSPCGCVHAMPFSTWAHCSQLPCRVSVPHTCVPDPTPRAHTVEPLQLLLLRHGSVYHHRLRGFCAHNDLGQVANPLTPNICAVASLPLPMF